MSEANDKKEDVVKESNNVEPNESLELEKKVESLELELSEQKDIFLRIAAEYENYRKRSERDKVSIYADSVINVVREILPVVDSLKLAIAAQDSAKGQDSSSDEHKKGLDLIARQLSSVFEKLGVESFGKVGENFDPNVHSAISHAEDESLEKNSVAEVFQQGYKIGDKIIRHAVVKTVN
ncbi:MAG: nucleotide exchange factor GrpE [Oscillospiraceae bacterium]|nr:nucleotide exchange factor GrpE [Oscillospiraceae bacterium]